LILKYDKHVFQLDKNLNVGIVTQYVGLDFSLGNEKGEILEQVVGLKVPISGQKLRTKGKISKFNYLKVS
jgi:hypothetical protein